MTDQQLTAIKALAARYNSNMAHVNILEEPFDLPSGWVSTVVIQPGTRRPAIIVGVSPEGNVHS